MTPCQLLKTVLSASLSTSGKAKILNWGFRIRSQRGGRASSVPSPSASRAAPLPVPAASAVSHLAGRIAMSHALLLINKSSITSMAAGVSRLIVFA